MTHYITWADFCLPRQPLRFALAPPNEDVSHVGQLKHGRRDYDSEMLAYSRDMLAYNRGDSIEQPKDWRLKVGDKFAGIYICENPEVKPCLDNGYQRPLLWDSTVLYECLTENSPRLIQAVHKAAENHGSMGAMRFLQGQLVSVFRNEFKTMSELSGWHMQNWPKAIHYFEYSVELVSQWVLMHYEMFPLWWGPLVSKYADVSPEWEAYVGKLAEQAAIGDGRVLTFTRRKVEP